MVRLVASRGGLSGLKILWLGPSQTGSLPPRHNARVCPARPSKDEYELNRDPPRRGVNAVGREDGYQQLASVGRDFSIVGTKILVTSGTGIGCSP